MKQEPNETIDEFHTRPQMASKYCEFGENKEKEIKAQIELGTISKKLRRYSFRTPTLTLTELLDYARTLHETEKQAKGIEAKTQHSPMSPSNVYDDVNKVQSSKPTYPKLPARQHTTTSASKQCFRCGYAWPHPMGSKCPAEGQQCSNCSKYNHFARVCRSRRKTQTEDAAHAIQQTLQNTTLSPQHESTDGQQTTDSDDSDDLFAYTLHKKQAVKNQQPSFNTKLKLGNSHVRFQIDSGSSANIIDENTFKTIKQQNPSICLKKSKKRLFAFGSTTPLPVLGQFECVLESKKRFTTAKIIVVQKATGCLLSGETSIDLNFITVNVHKIQSKSAEKPAKISKLPADKKIPLRLKPVITKYDEVFHGIGKLTGMQSHLHINKDVTPIVQPTRRIPFALRQKLESELQHLQQQDIIEPAQGPSIWVSLSLFSQNQITQIKSDFVWICDKQTMQFKGSATLSRLLTIYSMT